MGSNSLTANARYFLRVLLAWASDVAVPLRFNRTKQKDWVHIFVIRLDNIGDFVMWVPVARLLRKCYPAPRFRVTLLANASWAQYARDLAIFDDVWSVNRGQLLRDLGYRRGWIRKIKRAGFSMVINPLYTREFGLGDLIARACGARESVGFIPEPGQRDRMLLALGNHWYTKLVNGVIHPLHEIDRNREFAMAVFKELPDYTIPWLPAAPVGCSSPALPKRNYAVLCPGSSNPRKNWPLDRFAEIARRLQATTGLSVVVCGAPGERELGEALAARAGAGVLNLIGKTSIADLSALVRRASILISNDTAAAHFAAAHGTPCISIAGGGHPGRFLPYPDGDVDRGKHVTVTTRMECFGCGWSCKFRLSENEAFPCIERNGIDAVWRHVEVTLADSNRAK